MQKQGDTMAEVTYRPAHVKGEVRIPPSKSAAHRALLSAALCKTPCRVGPIDHSADMEATLNGVCAMGGTVKAEENGVLCIAPGTAPQSVTVDCGESGSTLRFLIPVFAALGIEATFVGHGRLPERPIGVYTDLLPQHGVTVETAGGLPFHITGKLQSGDFRVPGNISSQFITGLLFALPLLKNDSTVTLTTPLESKGYIDLTIEVLAGFGVKIEETETGTSPAGRRTAQSTIPSRVIGRRPRFFSRKPLSPAALSACSAFPKPLCKAIKPASISGGSSGFLSPKKTAFMLPKTKIQISPTAACTASRLTPRKFPIWCLRSPSRPRSRRARPSFPMRSDCT